MYSKLQGGKVDKSRNFFRDENQRKLFIVYYNILSRKISHKKAHI